jgi:hypothetical protein
MDVDRVSDVSEIHTASIFRVELGNVVALLSKYEYIGFEFAVPMTGTNVSRES